MSLLYPAGGALGALGVVGLCRHPVPTLVTLPTRGWLIPYPDMLFNGEGEHFNVSPASRDRR